MNDEFKPIYTGLDLGSESTSVYYGTPESFGWLRRPECERPGTFVYEKPNGELQTFKNDKAVFLARQIVKEQS